MSYSKQRVLSLTGVAGLDLNSMTEEELHSVFSEIMNDGIHGLCFSLYEDGQKPGDIISEEQVRRRMEIISPYTKWVRSFSCTEGNELIPKVAKEYGLKTLVGAWLGTNPEVNEREVAGLIDLANKGYVDLAAVGNEVMYRKDLTEEELLAFISRVKKAIPTIPVGYVDAYYEFTDRPKITALCDVVMANCYPFWEECSYEYSLVYMKNMFHQAMNAAKGKKVIISETGWPCQGEALGGAIPSYHNALKYFINTQLWTKAEKIETFYFSSFDESWKIGPEGDVGAFWGIWDKNEKIKF